MSKVDKLLISLNDYISKAEEEDDEKLTDVVPDFPGLESIPGFVEEYEKAIAKLLRNQRKWMLDEFNSFVSKNDGETLANILAYFTGNLFAVDEFAEELEEETVDFLQMTIEELCKELMSSVDEDVAFDTLSQRTLNWIKQWATDLADLMQLNTHKAVENILLEGIKNGESIQQIELKLKDLPQFDRNRARTTAITEVLTASSRAQWESYQQSPAVTGKKWKHSGAQKINPRKAHVDLDGTVIAVDEKFDVNGHEADYPRDPSLPAGERVNCHCAMGPVVDESILGLSKEEKEEIRRQVLEELNS